MKPKLKPRVSKILFLKDTPFKQKIEKNKKKEYSRKPKHSASVY